MARKFGKFTEWPEHDDHKAAAEIVRMYGAGLAGCYRDDNAKAALLDSVDWPYAEAACHAFGLADSGAGKLSLTFPAIEMLFPGSLPGPAQGRGDCVSHSTKNAGLATMCCEIVAAQPDEQTRRVEGAPQVSPAGIAGGVLSTEAIYWWRRHGGDGWSCGEACSVVKAESGLWLRQNYDSLGIDLTNYSAKTAGKWGSQTPPAEVKAIGQPHLIRTVTNIDGFEALRDLIANGYGVSTCGGEGWSNQRDENGFSRRSGSWSHAMAMLACDDRDVAKQKYGEPLVLIQNSWGKFNSGGRRILGTTLDIPEGSFWAKWSDAKRRDMYALSSFSGWPAQKLPDWGASSYLGG